MDFIAECSAQSMLRHSSYHSEPAEFDRKLLYAVGERGGGGRTMMKVF